MTRWLLLAGLLTACGSDVREAPDTALADTVVETAPVETAVPTEVIEVAVEETVALEDLVEDVAVEDVAEVGPELDVWVPPADPFDRGVMQLTIGLSDLSRSLLGLEPRALVPATCAIEAVPIACEAALVGDERTLRALDGKASFRIRFAPDNPLGLEGLLVDAQLDEPSQLRTLVAHLVFRRLRLAAPRASLARVVVDGVDFGVYVAVESISSPHFLEDLADTSAGSLFAPDSALDLWPWQIGDMVLVRGAESDRQALTKLSEALEVFRIARIDGAPVELDKTIGERVDLDTFLPAMAAEIWLGHRAGYPRGTRDYALHVVGDVVRFVPEHLGDSLDEGDQADPWWSGGRLLRHCFEDAECRPRWGLALDKMLLHLDNGAVLTEVSALRFLVNAELANDPRAELSPDDVADAQDQLMLVLADRSSWIAANLRCTEPADVDHDGDGASNCLDDCDDDAASVHPGATETCNLRDDDCDGVLDDGAGCPLCVEATTAMGRLALCYAPKTYAVARETCAGQGGALVTIRSQIAFDAVRRAALGVQWNSWWIGLDDLTTEGTFVWADGSPYSASELAGWSGSEPNDSGGNEDCAHLTPWSGALWNDLDCARSLPFVCALPED